MLVALLFLVITYLVARYLLKRYTGNRTVANAAAAAIVLWYLLGAAMHPPLFGRPGTGVAVSPSASPPGRISLTASQLGELVPVQGISALGNIDVLTKSDGSPAGSRFRLNAKVGVNGWIADPTLRTPGAGLVFIIDGKQRFDATRWYGVDRPDVVRAYGAPALSTSGFHAAPLPLHGLARGRHILTVGVVAPDGRRYYTLPTGFTFETF